LAHGGRSGAVRRQVDHEEIIQRQWACGHW
jgi:hypothetical protein